MREQLGAYLAHLASIERKPRTLRTMGSVVDNALIPALGAIPVVDLRALHLREAYQQFRDKGRGAGYVHLAQAIVSGALKLAVADGIVAANVAAGVRTAPVPKRNPPIVGEHIDVAAFLAAIAGARFEAAYIVALACGLRNHELRALRWADVDLERGELVVSGGTQPSAKGEVRGGTKSPSGLRRVAFGSFVSRKSSRRSRTSRTGVERGKPGLAGRDGRDRGRAAAHAGAPRPARGGRVAGSAGARSQTCVRHQQPRRRGGPRDGQPDGGA
jgi:integrase